MRLIDADSMAKRLQEWNRNDDMDKALYNFAFNRIMEQPTAYDVEEVVEELEQMLESLSDCGDDWFTAEKINDAIEIVKGGVK